MTLHDEELMNASIAKFRERQRATAPAAPPALPPKPLKGEKPTPKRKRPSRALTVDDVLEQRPGRRRIAGQAFGSSVLELVAAEFLVDAAELSSPCREARLVLARNVASRLLHELCGWSTTEIGGLLQRNHTTVLHGMATLRDRCTAERELRLKVRRLGATLNELVMSGSPPGSAAA